MDNLSIKNLPNPVRLFLGLLSNQSPAALKSSSFNGDVVLGTPRYAAMQDHCLVFNFDGGYVPSLRFVFTATPSNGDCNLCTPPFRMGLAPIVLHRGVGADVYDKVDGEE